MRRYARTAWRAAAIAAVLARPALAASRVPALEPHHRLADEHARARGLAEVPVAAVGDVVRYVLDAPRITKVPTVRVVHPADGASELVVDCTEQLARSPVAVTLRDDKVAYRARELLECGAPPGVGSVDVMGLPRRPGFAPTLALHAPPARRVATGWFTPPAGAALRVAVGLADPRPLSTAAAARLRVVAENRSGRRHVVAARTLEPAIHAGDVGWQPIAAPLDGARAVLGPEIRLVFRTRPLRSGDRAAFAVWGDPTVVAPAATARAPRPNVVLVSLDTLRADRLGAYGGPLPTSPVLDAFARDGTLFEVGMANAVHTLPSHATMFTGRYPCAHRLGRHHPEMDFLHGTKLARRVPVLAELLRGQGYATAAFTEDAYVGLFQRGFGVFRDNVSADFHRPEGLVEQTVDGAVEWLRREAFGPFLLFVHTYQVHWPYEPPHPYREWFTVEDMQRTAAGVARPAAAEASLALYDAEIRYTDAVLGDLLRALDELGLRDDTIVVVTSDHGEAFGEHGHILHNHYVHDEVVRVPFVWRAPGLVRAGHRVHEPVGLVDLVPTLLDLLALPVPAGVQGRSVTPLLRGEPAPQDLQERMVFGESLGATRFAVRTARWKAIIEQPQGPTAPPAGVAVFLPAVDPQERQPVSLPQVEQEAVRARDALEAECERLASPPAAEERPAGADGADPTRERTLRALGYIE
jgi:arylsulfatase A-like enzyme